MMISIAMATYNGEKFLRTQLDSILSQTYNDIELIICDDNSTDSTRHILQEYEKKDSRIKLYFNKNNLGFLKNFEKAITLCTGDYIALSDQDDIWETTKLEHLLQNIGNNDFICSNSMLIDENGNSKNITMKDTCNYHWIPKSQDAFFKRILFSNIVQGSTMLAKSDFLKSCSSVPAEIEFHDYWFAFNACAKNGFAYLDECTIRYRQHSKNVTTNEKKYFKDELKKNNFTQDKYKTLCEFNQKYVIRYEILLKTIDFSEKQKTFIRKAIRYQTELKNKTLYTFLFFLANCKYIYLDNNVIRNSLRIFKRFLGLIYWKLIERRKVI